MGSQIIDWIKYFGYRLFFQFWFFWRWSCHRNHQVIWFKLTNVEKFLLLNFVEMSMSLIKLFLRLTVQLPVIITWSMNHLVWAIFITLLWIFTLWALLTYIYLHLQLTGTTNLITGTILGTGMTSKQQKLQLNHLHEIITVTSI